MTSQDTTQAGGWVDAVLLAALNAPHSINAKKIVLEFDRLKPGHNATNQLHLRIEAALTSLQSAAEGLEEALKIVASSGKFQCFDDEAWESVNTALSAYNQLKKG